MATFRVYEVSVESDQDSSLALIYEWTETRRAPDTGRVRRQTVHAAGIGPTSQQAVLNAAKQWAGVHEQGASQIGS